MPTNEQTISTIAKYPAWSVWLLVLLVFATHGMLLLNDGVYWDGWVLQGYYLNHDVESLLGIFRDAGSPWMGYFHLSFWYAPNLIFAYKLVSFLGILASTILVYFIVQRISILSARERWFIAAMFCCYSAFQANVDIIIAGMRTNFSIFLLGAYVALRSFEVQGRVALVLRILALVCLVVGFTTSSLLVLYFPLLLLFLMGRQQEWLGKNFRGKIVALSRYGDFILLPLIYYWLLRRAAWKPQHEYAGYNGLIFDPRQWAIDFWQSIDNAIFAQFQNVHELAGNRPLLATAIFIAAIVVERSIAYRRSRKTRLESIEHTGRFPNVAEMLKITLMALMLLVCAIFPYVAVGKFPDVAGWDSRHALLISLPIAVGLVAIGRWLPFIFLPKLVPLISRVAAVLLVLAFTLVTCKIYLEWQVRWIKDSSFIVNLRKLPREQISKVNTIRMTVDSFQVGYGIYRFYEYAGMFKLAWGDESRIGFHSSFTQDTEWILKNIPLRRLLLKDFRAGGCEVNMTLRPKHPDMSRIELVSKYLIYRWFKPAELSNFLADVTIVGMTDFSCPSKGAANR